MKRSLLVPAFCLGAWLAYLGVVRYLEERDVVGALLTHRELSAGLLTVLVLGLRSFLILLAPGLLLWLVVGRLERRFRR